MPGGGGDVHSNSKMGGFKRRKTLSIGGKCQLEKVAGSEAHKVVATESINIGAGPGCGVAFEANNRHVGGDPGDPTSELWSAQEILDNMQWEGEDQENGCFASHVHGGEH